VVVVKALATDQEPMQKQANSTKNAAVGSTLLLVLGFVFLILFRSIGRSTEEDGDKEDGVIFIVVGDVSFRY